MSAWPAAKIVVTYEAGYNLPDDVPQEIEQAALVVLKHLYFGTARDPAARAEVIDGAGSTTYSDGAVMAQVDELLSSHRVPQIG